MNVATRCRLLPLLIVVGCATSTQPPSPESARIVVAMSPVSRQAVITAFTAEGLLLASAQGEVIVSVPVDVGMAVLVTYRATLTDSAVVLSGTFRELAWAAVVGAEAPENTLHSGMTSGSLGGAWQRVVRIARRLEQRNP